MKTTGIVRRVDELGRIVIPKEIRARLKMDSGDLVDIFVDNQDIVLSKFHPLNHDTKLIASFCESLKETYHTDIIITDLVKLVYNTISSEYDGEQLTDDFLKRVPSFLEKEISSLHKMNITSQYVLNKDAIIYEIVSGTEPYGYLILLDDLIGKKQKDLAGFILNYLNRVL